MAAFNKVILIGHLTDAPELKQTQSGVYVTSFTIGVNRRYAAEGKQETDFINIVCWRKTAEIVCQYFGKGSAILVCGALQQRAYTDKEGLKRYVFEVVADEVSFVERKADSGSADSKPAEPTQKKDEFETLDPDDELPF